MGQRIHQFCESLRLKLANVESNISALKAKVDGKARTAEQDVQDHLNAVKRHIDRERVKVSAARAEMANWAEDQRVVTREKIAEWKANLETAKLQDRADRAERYAAAAAEVAVAAVDDAEQASLEAWLARADARYAEHEATG